MTLRTFLCSDEGGTSGTRRVMRMPSPCARSSMRGVANAIRVGDHLLERLGTSAGERDGHEAVITA